MYKKDKKSFYCALLLSMACACLPCSQVLAQSVTLNLATEYQTIRGFGGMNAVGWIGDSYTDSTRITNSWNATLSGTNPGSDG